MATIDIEKFVKRYGSVEVLHGINLHIADGEFVVLLGPSGCGKSTMLRMIAGLEDISGGTLQIAGKMMNTVPARDRDIAMVFQNYALYPHMSAYDNIAFGLRRLKVPKLEIDRRVRQTADLLALGPYLSRKPRQLSGGQQQRVAMGRAMIKTPLVFLFDEPLSNLDATLRDQLRVEVKKLHMMLRTTTVFVTHDQLEAMTLGDKIVIMREGHVEQIGTPREVYHAPESLFVARFIGSPAMNLLPMQVAEDGILLQADGLSIAIDPCFAASLHPGQAVTLGFRPKDLRLAWMVPGAEHYAALVALSEMMGAETLLQLRIGSHEFTMLVDDRDTPLVGSSIKVAIAPEGVRLFDSTTQKAIRLPR